MNLVLASPNPSFSSPALFSSYGPCHRCHCWSTDMGCLYHQDASGTYPYLLFGKSNWFLLQCSLYKSSHHILHYRHTKWCQGYPIIHHTQADYHRHYQSPCFPSFCSLGTVHSLVHSEYRLGYHLEQVGR